MSKQQDKGGFIAGTILGAAVGAVVALLFAPKAGKETQEELKQRAKQVVKDNNIKIAQVETELEGQIDTLKAAARDLRGEAYEESQRLITRAEMLKNDLQDSATQLSKTSKEAKQSAAADAKSLMTEGQVVLDELIDMTERIIVSPRRNGKRNESASDARKTED